MNKFSRCILLLFLVSFTGIHDEPRQKICKLNELLNYLVHILKQELYVNDLKEKAVIHSKSINEHFSEPFIKDLQSLKHINDYSQLHTSLVYALLRINAVFWHSDKHIKKMSTSALIHVYFYLYIVSVLFYRHKC